MTDGAVFQKQNTLPPDQFGTTFLNEAEGLGQNASLLRDPHLMQVAPTRDDLAMRHLTDGSRPLFARVPTATTTALVFRDATKLRTDTDTILRPSGMRTVGPSQSLLGEFEDFQYHPTVASTSSDARGGKTASGAADALAGAWRYPFTDVGVVAAGGLVTSMLNFQENKDAQHALERHATAQQNVAMPGATQMHGYESSGMFQNGGSVWGTAPAAQTQGVLTTVPATGAVITGNRLGSGDPLAALRDAQEHGIQAERILIHDNTLRQTEGFRDPDQFR